MCTLNTMRFAVSFVESQLWLDRDSHCRGIQYRRMWTFYTEQSVQKHKRHTSSKHLGMCSSGESEPIEQGMQFV